MKKAILICLSFMALLAIHSCKGKQEVQAAVELEVPVVKVMQQDITLESEYAGQTYGESDVEVRSRVEGWVETVSFKEGTMVRKGQLLYTIDQLPYQNMVDQAKAALAEAQTGLIKAKNDLDRIKPLAEVGAVSQRELVAAQAQYDASVAMVAASEASLNNARIELGYCRVTAPITGMIGISAVKVGDFVGRGPQFVLTTVSSIDNLRVRFTISEVEYLRIARLMKELGITMGKGGDNVTMVLSDGGVYPLKGRMNFADRQVDPSTGAMTFEAQFMNSDNLLRPGQYVKIRLVTDLRKGALLIPQRAVTEMQGMFQVFALADSNKIEPRFVRLGPAYNMSYVVDQGLTSDDRIVIGGTQLLRAGSVVKPSERVWSPDSTNISTVLQ
jgi:membrane fusion protein (multidrug efflux system)